MVAISLAALTALFNELCNAGVCYKMGAKDPSSGFIDCSGWTRYACERLAPEWGMPDGSYNQLVWCEDHELHQARYEDAARADDSRLFLCFITAATSTDGTGHVWFLNGGQTMESHGRDASGDGIDARPWNTPVLVREVYRCYELPTI